MADSDGEYWSVVILRRDDLDACGFDSSQVDDETMGKLADAMGDIYCAFDFQTNLQDLAEEFGIPERGGV